MILQKQQKYTGNPFERSPHSLLNKMLRSLWGFVWLFFFRPTPKILHGWRRFLLRLFGSEIGKGSCIYSSAKIWAPWNLEIGNYSCISYNVDCYCVDKIKIGSYTTISQYSFLCTASHDYTLPEMPLTTAPIDIGDNVWIATDVYISPGIKIGDGAMIGARSSVFKNVSSWTITAGSPARFIKNREFKNEKISSI